MTDTTELPPLPEPENIAESDGCTYACPEGWSADQMFAYGEECRRLGRRMALEEAERGCHALGDKTTADMQKTRGIRARELLSSAALTAYNCASVLRALKDKA